MAAKLAARTLAKEQMASLQEQVLTKLASWGMFPDPIAQEIEGHFMPWLLDATARVVKTLSVGRGLTDALIGDAAAEQAAHITGQLVEVNNGFLKIEEERLAKEAAAQAELDAAAAAEAAALAAAEAPPASARGEDAPPAPAAES